MRSRKALLAAAPNAAQPDDVRHRRSPHRSPELAVTAFGDVGSQPVRYFVYTDVFAELMKAARYRSEVATAVLMGQFGVDGDTPFVEISGFCDLEYTYGGDALELTAPVVRALLDEEDGECAGPTGSDVVGVFVAIPESEAKIKREAARLHLSLFNRPYQPLLIADGVGGRVGLYGRPAREGFFNAPFALVERRKTDERDAADDEPKSAMTETETMDDADRDCGIGGTGDIG